MLKQAFLVVLIGVVIYGALFMTKKFGLFLQFQQHYPGKCSVVNGHNNLGSEDMSLTSSGLVFITSGVSCCAMPPLFKQYLKDQNIKGKIYLYDFNTPNAGVKELKILGLNTFNSEEFRPHGISVLEDKVKGEHLVYVINHMDIEGDIDDRIEKFKFNPKTKELKHLKSIKDNLFHITNDLAVTEEDKFYITNYLNYKSFVATAFEALLKLPIGAILYYDGSKAVEAVPGLASPNGITASKDNKHLYVMMPGDEKLIVYSVKSEKTIEKVQEVKLHTGCDNSAMNIQGDVLYSGCHPSAIKLIKAYINPYNKTPGQVLRIPLSKDGLVDEKRITEEFFDHGDLISASTVGIAYKNRLLVGSIIDTLVACDGKINLN